MSKGGSNVPTKKKKIKKGTPPPVDKLLKPAIGVALALVAYQFIRGLGSGIARISLINEVELREVLYGESNSNNYVVLCQSEESTAPISSVFQDAYNEKVSAAMFRVMDCEATIPSTGKSVVEEFSINVQQRPTIFVSGGTVPRPTQVPDKHLKTGSMLNKYLRAKLEKHAVKIETTQDLRTKCLSKDVCALLLKGGKKAPSHIKDAVAKLLKEYPDVTFASVDTSVLYVLHLEEYLPEFQKDTTRFVVFRKVSGSLQATDHKNGGGGGGRLITSMTTTTTTVDQATYGPMSNLVAQVLQKTATMQKLSSLPQIKTRTKKLEESERAKRQRKADQKKRQAESSSSSSSGGTSSGGGGGGSSDDMKEERRRERERRRAEHNAAHNVKPKTPEEIAEMERKRRERMEQEAAKWNMAPEDDDNNDAPHAEGDNGGSGSYMFDDDEDDYEDTESYVVVEDVVDSVQDDEDVIDLD